MLAASKRVPAKDAKELLQLARRKPGELNYGSAGVGSVNHMAMELLKSLARLDIKHVPYRSGNAAVNDLVGDHVDMFVGSLPQMIELMRAGHGNRYRHNRAAAIGSDRRFADARGIRRARLRARAMVGNRGSGRYAAWRHR